MMKLQRQNNTAIRFAIVSVLFFITPIVALAQATTSTTTVPTTTATSTAPVQNILLEIFIGDTKEVQNLSDYIILLYRFIVSSIGIIAAVMIMYWGLRWAAAAGNQEIIGKAKEGVESALIGLIIALASYLILYVINPQLVDIAKIEPLDISFVEPAEDLSSTSCASTTSADEDCSTVEVDKKCSTFSNGYPNLYSSAAASWNNVACQFYSKYGKPVPVNNGFRSVEKQACLRDRPSGDYAADMCSSNHVKGAAVDLNLGGLTQEQYNWLVCRDDTPGHSCPIYKTTTSSSFGKWVQVKNGIEGWKVLNYNTNIKDTGALEEDHHFDYSSPPNICTVCPKQFKCGCGTGASSPGTVF